MMGTPIMNVTIIYMWLESSFMANFSQEHGTTRRFLIRLHPRNGTVLSILLIPI